MSDLTDDGVSRVISDPASTTIPEPLPGGDVQQVQAANSENLPTECHFTPAPVVANGGDQSADDDFTSDEDVPENWDTVESEVAESHFSDSDEVAHSQMDGAELDSADIHEAMSASEDWKKYQSANSASEGDAENNDPTGEPVKLVRLQKLLAAAGFGSRRACEDLIREGRVAIDGAAVTEMGLRIDPYQQRVFVDGERVKPQRKVYYLLNKPKGYLCTNSDPDYRRRAIDLLPPTSVRLFTVGRLDENSEGLLIVTNDGDLSESMAHPRFQVPRVYRALVAGDPSPEVLEVLKRGMHFEEGKFRMRDVKRMQSRGRSTILEITMTEGQNREIRRLLARVGHKVMALKRVAFGPVRLGTLETGEYRPLRSAELAELKAYLRGERREEAAGSGSRPEGRPQRERRSAMDRGGERPRRARPAGDGDAEFRRAESQRPPRRRPQGRPDFEGGPQGQPYQNFDGPPRRFSQGPYQGQGPRGRGPQGDGQFDGPPRRPPFGAGRPPQGGPMGHGPRPGRPPQGRPPYGGPPQGRPGQFVSYGEGFGPQGDQGSFDGPPPPRRRPPQGRPPYGAPSDGDGRPPRRSFGQEGRGPRSFGQQEFGERRPPGDRPPRRGPRPGFGQQSFGEPSQFDDRPPRGRPPFGDVPPPRPGQFLSLGETGPQSGFVAGSSVEQGRPPAGQRLRRPRPNVGPGPLNQERFPRPGRNEGEGSTEGYVPRRRPGRPRPGSKRPGGHGPGGHGPGPRRPRPEVNGVRE